MTKQISSLILQSDIFSVLCKPIFKHTFVVILSIVDSMTSSLFWWILQMIWEIRGTKQMLREIRTAAKSSATSGRIPLWIYVYLLFIMLAYITHTHTHYITQLGLPMLFLCSCLLIKLETINAFCWLCREIKELLFRIQYCNELPLFRLRIDTIVWLFFQHINEYEPCFYKHWWQPVSFHQWDIRYTCVSK